MDCSASAFGYAASTYTGQNWGANRLDRVRMGVRSTLVLALSFSALLAAGMILFGRHVVALFISADAANAAEALSVAYDYLVVMSTFCCPPMCCTPTARPCRAWALRPRPCSRSDRVRRPCGCIAAADQGHR